MGTKEYTIIICIGLFIVFSLVGYLIELTKRNKEIDKNSLNSEEDIIPQVEDVKINDVKNMPKKEEVEVQENKTDELLEDYNNDIEI